TKFEIQERYRELHLKDLSQIESFQIPPIRISNNWNEEGEMDSSFGGSEIADPFSEDPEVDIFLCELRTKVAAFLATLNVQEREIVELAFFGDFSEYRLP